MCVYSYKFKNRYLLQLALTHPSYKENFGTNPDHARNTLTNCGIRQPEYGDRKIHYMNTRKRGINTLINIMSRFGKTLETDSKITHNERLEFLGDAVVEFLSSIHLFYMFPELEEGGLATYRAAIVQNQHLAVLARKFRLEEFMLYAHGSDLCHELELRHAMANCFEALMGALLLDGGIDVADGVFAHAFFMAEEGLRRLWKGERRRSGEEKEKETEKRRHPLQEQEPLGDRKWIDNYQMLQNLVRFEDSIGVKFTHIRLLARAFTDRSIGFTNLTLGSNQRLEFLGDTVLQLICSEFLYRHFPEHHEGHLSLLRSSLVNNRTQSVVCDDLGMTQYAVYSNPKSELKTKDRADLLEAFLGALYVDKGLEFCERFCQVGGERRGEERRRQSSLGCDGFCFCFDWIEINFLLPGLPVPPAEGLYHEPGLERPQVEVAAVLPDAAHHGRRGAGHSDLQGDRVDWADEHADLHGGRVLPREAIGLCDGAQYPAGGDECGEEGAGHVAGSVPAVGPPEEGHCEEYEEAARGHDEGRASGCRGGGG